MDDYAIQAIYMRSILDRMRDRVEALPLAFPYRSHLEEQLMAIGKDAGMLVQVVDEVSAAVKMKGIYSPDPGRIDKSPV